MLAGQSFSHSANLRFSGKDRFDWADGPNFLEQTLVGLDITLRSRETALPDKSIRTDSKPAMPLLAGPVAIYDLGGGNFIVQIKYVSESTFANFSAEGPEIRLRIVLGPGGAIVICNGNVVHRYETNDATMQAKAFLTGGVGYLDRFWCGDIVSLRAIVGSEGQFRAFELSSTSASPSTPMM